VNHDRFVPFTRRRYLVAVVVACAALATAGAATAAAAGSTSASGTSVHTIHLEGHETQHQFISQGGFGDEEIFSGNLDNAAGNFSQVGIFAGTLMSVRFAPSLEMATVDLQLQGGQIAAQGFVDLSKLPIVHAVIGGTGIYRGVRGELSFYEPSGGVLDITVTMLPSGRNDSRHGWATAAQT
jgi:hypothetical protein